MTTNERSDLLACLREVDEIYAQKAPDPSLEARVVEKLRARSQSKRSASPLVLFRGLWAVRRPLVLALAAGSVFVLSMMGEGDGPAPKQGIAAPQASVEVPEPLALPDRDRAAKEPPSLTSPPRTFETPANEPSERRDPPLQMPAPLVPEGDDGEPLPWNDGRAPSPQWAPLMSQPVGPSRRDDAASDGFSFWSPSTSVSPISSPQRVSVAGEMPDFSSTTNTRPPRNREATPPMQPCLDTGVLSKQAHAACEKDGLVVSDLIFLDPCGDKMFRSEKHVCVEPDGEDEACTTQKLGDGVKCMDPGMLKQLAFEACLGMDLDLVDLLYDPSDCGGKPRIATYTCCPKSPEPPPAEGMCKSSTIGDGINCMELGIVKKDATAACAAMGMALVDYLPSGDCPMGKASSAAINCCME